MFTPSPAPSSGDVMARRVLDALGEHGVEVDVGDGDEWPAIREKLLAADAHAAVSGFSWMPGPGGGVG